MTLFIIRADKEGLGFLNGKGSTRLETVEKTVDDLLKFRWQTAAIIGAAILVMGAIIPFLDNMMEHQYNGKGMQTSLVHELH
jgi:hypothetical protein